MKRVVQAALALALAVGLCVAAPPAATAAEACGYYTDAELAKWVRWLSTERQTGNDAHLKLLENLETELKSIPSVPPIRVKSQDQSFTRWQPEEPPTLWNGVSGQVPGKVWALPYSGLTDANGVSGKLYYEGRICPPLFHFDARKHRGKIVVVKLRMLDLRWALMGFSQRSIPRSKQWFPGDYERAIVFERTVPSLEEARRAGVVGLIVIVDEHPAVAVNQYVPFTRARQDVPAVFVDRGLGETLAKMAKDDVHLTIRHPGKYVPDARTRHLIAILPATQGECDISCPGGICSAIVVGTHTDGPNFFEENGVVALWSLLRTFAEQPCRPRDLVFAFASSHFVHEPGSMDDVIRGNPDVFERTRAALVIEHLGAMQSRPDGTPVWKAEPALVLTTAHDGSLNSLARAALDHRMKADPWLQPTYWLMPMYFDYGEGKFLEEADIPTIGYLTNPPYLVSKEDSHTRWFSPQLMCKQVDMFAELIDRMMKLGPLASP